MKGEEVRKVIILEVLSLSLSSPLPLSPGGASLMPKGLASRGQSQDPQQLRFCWTKIHFEAKGENQKQS